MKKAVAIILTLAFLLSLAACGGGSESETTTAATEQASAVNADIESTVAVTEHDDDPTFLTLFRYPDSTEYKAIKKAEIIETGIDGEFNETWKFRAEKDGVKVRLEKISWVIEVGNFQIISDAFEIETQKGKYYEFSCPVGEAIPEYRLVAEYGGFRVEYYIQYDGKGDDTKAIEIIGEKYYPGEITEDSPFYALCLSHAITAADNDNDTAVKDDNVFWMTFAFAVTQNYEAAGGDAFNGEKIKLTEWAAKAYLSALYPSFNGAYPDFPDDGEVVYTLEAYEIMPCSYGDLHSSEFYGVEDNGDRTYTVKIKVCTYLTDGEVLEADKAVIVKPLDSYDENNPFGYTVLRVEDCELPRG
ncbi:MAG: hypothetical protein ACI4IX_01840 [Acutalibacteraceae bacterium]